MAKQTFTSGQVLTASQMSTLQANDYNMSVTTGTASYTLQASDKGTRRVQNMGSAGTVTIPNSTFDAGDALWLHSIGSGTQTISAGAGLTLNSSAGTAPTLAQWEGGVVYFTSASAAIFFRGGGSSGISIEYLVIAGGGGGNSVSSSGGGAGGYRSSVVGENSGGGLSAETALTAAKGAVLELSIGAGGAVATNGSLSTFGIQRGVGVISQGGGSGNAVAGGSGSGRDGAQSNGAGGAGSVGQGFAGGAITTGAGSGNEASAGGGGAGSVGATLANASTGTGSNGGSGVSSSITGSSVGRGGGGGGGARFTTGTGVGTDGGGSAGVAGSANTGGGGGGKSTGSSQAGGSGVVIIRYPDAFGTLASIGAGLTSTTGTYTSGGTTYRFYSFTAGTDTVTLPS